MNYLCCAAAWRRDRQSSHTHVRLSSAAAALRCIRAVKQISALLSPLGRRRWRRQPTHSRHALPHPPLGCCVCVGLCWRRNRLSWRHPSPSVAPRVCMCAPRTPFPSDARPLARPRALLRSYRAPLIIARLRTLEIHSEFTAVCGNFRQFPSQNEKEGKKGQVSVFALFSSS